MRLVEKLKDENPGGRCYAAEELGHIGDVSAIPYLIELLEDDHQEVRSSVARALGEIGHQSALTALLKSLSDPVGSVRVWVVYAIEQIGVAAVPGSSFYRNRKDGAQQIRFCFCKKDETLQEAGQRLRSLDVECLKPMEG